MKEYIAWFIVAYFNGIDQPPVAVTQPFRSATECGDMISVERKRLRIPDSVVVGCQPKHYNIGGDK
jgi:hypothetical protein